MRSPNASTSLDLLCVSSNAFRAILLLLAPKLLLELLQLPLHFVNSVCLNRAVNQGFKHRVCRIAPSCQRYVRMSLWYSQIESSASNEGW
jgi:hypothetical protein